MNTHSPEYLEFSADLRARMLHKDFVRHLSAQMSAGSKSDVVNTFRTRWPLSLSVETVTKAPVTAGGLALTRNTPEALSAAFLASAQPFTALARLGLRPVPSNTPLNRATGPATFSWVGEARAKPVSAMTFAAETAIRPLKSQGTIIVSAEILKLEAVGAEDYILSELRPGYANFMDDALLNPTHAGSADVQPASITSAAATVASTGVSASNAVHDLRALLELFVGVGGHVETAAIVLTPENSVALHLTGHELFRGLRRDGGTLGGLPVVTSSSAGDQIVMVDVAHVLVADEGQADFSVARHASVEMDTAPTSSGATGTGAATVSLWQSGLAGIRIERWLNWRADSGAVARISGAIYYAVGSPA